MREKEMDRTADETGSTRCDISRFSPRIDRIFPGEALNPFFGAQDEGFLEFRSLKNNEVTVNPKTQTLRKNWFFENPIP